MPKSPITTLSGLKIVPSSTNPNTGLYVPQLTQAQINAIPASTMANGGLFYNTDINKFQCMQNGTVYDLSLTNDNSGFQAPQLNQDQINAIPADASSNGDIFYNTTRNMFQVYQNGKRYNLYGYPEQDADPQLGTGLVNNTNPMIVPVGVQSSVEVPQNQIEGFLYFSMDNVTLRIFTINDRWVNVVPSSTNQLVDDRIS